MYVHVRMGGVCLGKGGAGGGWIQRVLQPCRLLASEQN